MNVSPLDRLAVDHDGQQVELLHAALQQLVRWRRLAPMNFSLTADFSRP